LEGLNGSRVQKLLTLVSRAAAYSSALFLTAMMSITVADVTLRALFNLPITGAYDLVQLFLVGTVFLSIPDVFLRDENIAIDLIDHIMGRTAVGLLKTFAKVAASVFLLVLSWRMIQPALDSIHFHEVSTDLSIPMIVHWCLMIAGIVLAVPAALALLIESVRHLAGAHESP
jgi:TRAP-type C4-dicarboxylate transport system permease small subunit